MRQDHIINKPTSTRNERVRKLGLVFRFTRRQLDRVTLVHAEDDFNGALGSHHRNLCIRPGKVDVTAQVF